MCQVPEEFIDDEFNLNGLSSMVPYFNEALELVLDMEPEIPDDLQYDGDMEDIEQAAEILYGLIHARYIITRVGLERMVQKYEFGDFGTCLRYK